MSNEIISDKYVNRIGEIMNIGMTSASNIMSGIINRDVSINNPKTEISKLSDLKCFGYDAGLMLGFSHNGTINGRISALFRKMDMDAVLHILMDTGGDDNDVYEIDELTTEIIREIANQMGTAFASSIGNIFSESMTCTIEDVKVFNNISSIGKILHVNSDDDIVAIHFDMIINDVLNSNMIIIFEHNLYDSIVSKITKNTAAKESHESNIDDDILQGGNDTYYSNMYANTMNKKRKESINVHDIQFPDFSNQKTNPLLKTAVAKENMEVLMKIPLSINVEIGRTIRKLSDIMNMKNGDVVIIDKQAGAPVDIVINGQLIARGDAMVMDDNFGVRITDIFGDKCPEDE